MMVKKKRINKTKLFTVIIFILIIGSLVTLNTYLIINKTNPNKEKSEEQKIGFTSHSSNGSIARINIPAVDNNGNGVSTVLTVEATPGSGKTLVDIDSLIFWADTQNSIRIAKLVATNITGIDTSKYDLFYDVKASNASIIAGPSAGSAITIATIAALENKNLKSDVMITGSINHDGTIGPVGDVLAKANAAKNAKANIFLVPLLQSKEITYEQREHCQRFGFSEFCSIEQIPKQVVISDEVGITVKEVSNIKEALAYFY